MEKIICQCGTFYHPSLTACPFCGRFKRAENILGTSITRWDEWLAKQGEPLSFDDSLEPADYDDDEIEWFWAGTAAVEDVRDIIAAIEGDSTGNANIDAFLKGMRW